MMWIVLLFIESCGLFHCGFFYWLKYQEMNQRVMESGHLKWKTEQKISLKKRIEIS